MKITIFTISDCYFSKQEKEYLQSHNLPFDEKNLEENREFLTEMLTISNNFAGTPVTKIEKDDGQIVVLKGFTKDEFDKTFNITDAPVTEAMPPKITLSEPVVEPVAPTPTPEPAPPAPPVQPAVTPASPTVDLGSIAAQIEQLKKLQESLAAQQTAAAPAPVAPPVAAAPAPAYQAPPMPEPVAQPVADVQSTPVAPQAQAPAPQAANVDDSLAAILAELQTKINSSQDSGTPGTPPAAN